MNTTKEDRLRKKKPNKEYWGIFDWRGTPMTFYEDQFRAESVLTDYNRHKYIGLYKIVRLKEVK